MRAFMRVSPARLLFSHNMGKLNSGGLFGPLFSDNQESEER